MFGCDPYMVTELPGNKKTQLYASSQSQNNRNKFICIVGNPDLYEWLAPGPIMCL